MARMTVTNLTALESHPKWRATPPQTPKTQRHLFARFMPMPPPGVPLPTFLRRGQYYPRPHPLCEAPHGQTPAPRKADTPNPIWKRTSSSFEATIVLPVCCL